MSTYEDYSAASSNSINENNFNAKKARSSKIHQLKRLLKPILALLKNSSRNTYVKNTYIVEDENESAQNDANERLEAKIFADIDSCPDLSAVPVYQDGRMDIIPVTRGQEYIPVHFARTDAGTFFWTSIAGADSDICYHGDKNAFSQCQVPEVQAASCDRWAQA